MMKNKISHMIIYSLLILAVSAGLMLVTSCSDDTAYKQISQSEAKEIMDSDENVIILDVRELYEYEEGHIKGAVLIPYTEIENRAATELPDKESVILVYCRSGRRSKIAAQTLADLGYKNVMEFGGINDWEYGIEK